MKIAILGAGGRMGQNLLRCAQKINGCEVVAAVERHDFPALGKQVNDFPAALVYTSEWPKQAEVVIDFTFHSCVASNIKQAAENQQAVVLGTTGLSEEEKQLVHDASQQIPIVWAANMSLMRAMTLKLSRRIIASKRMPPAARR
jgi:4-hydroxy-tetrahydrodipicolinate reductase